LKADVAPLYHMPRKPLYDKEYEAIVSRAEKLWAAKKRSTTVLNVAAQEGQAYNESSSLLKQRSDTEPFKAEQQDIPSYLRETDLDRVFQVFQIVFFFIIKSINKKFYSLNIF